MQLLILKGPNYQHLIVVRGLHKVGGLLVMKQGFGKSASALFYQFGLENCLETVQSKFLVKINVRYFGGRI